MKYTMRLAIGWALILAMSGCGSSNDPETMIKENIKIMNELADAMEKKAPQATIDAINKRGEQLKKQMDGMTISDSEKKRLGEKYMGELMNAGMRIAKAQMGNLPGDFKGLLDKGLPKIPDFKDLPEFKDLKVPDFKDFPKLPDPPK